MRVTWTGARPSARAANSPAKPPPTITTWREPDAVVIAQPAGSYQVSRPGSSRAASLGPHVPLA